MYFLDLDILHLQLVVFDVDPKKVNVGLFELAFVDVEVEVILFKDGEYFIDYLLVPF